MFQRTVFNRIKNSLKHYPVVIVTGPRQVGKSTEIYKLTQEGFHYVSLDNISNRREALEDPEFFIQQHGIPLIIDEIQYAPILMEVIESIVNEKRLKNGDANGMFILAGSQTFSMMKGVTQSLAGRVSILKMMPLSYSEIVGKEENPFLPSLEIYNKTFEPINVNDLYKIIVRGMYPELYKDKDSDTFEYYENYVNTYINRDVSELINIKDKLAFYNFLQYIASLTSQQVNYSDISKNIGVDSKTIKSWISILETSGIVYLLQPYSEYKLSKRITKSPKLYFCDTGLAAHLARVNNPEYLMISNLAGAFMETYVMNEIKKSYENNGLKFNGYYYRDNHQNEIDLILIDNMQLHCIEIKKGSMFEKKHVKSFNQLAHSQYEMGTSCIICNTEKNYAINRDILVLSLSCI
ncbi:MAG: ATP-binding protein [Erysipelotrichaceae bacterium]|nr:ATP-binding protein [Erysipelotrichaceae bacterium]